MSQRVMSYPFATVYLFMHVSKYLSDFILGHLYLGVIISLAQSVRKNISLRWKSRVYPRSQGLSPQKPGLRTKLKDKTKFTFFSWNAPTNWKIPKRQLNFINYSVIFRSYFRSPETINLPLVQSRCWWMTVERLPLETHQLRIMKVKKVLES